MSRTLQYDVEDCEEREDNKMTATEAWELARKIILLDKEDGFKSDYFTKVFCGMSKRKVLELSPYEVKKRIDEYDKENEISIGDIVVDEEKFKYLVLDKTINDHREKAFYLLCENGCVECINRSLVRKIESTNCITKILNVLNNITLR